MSTARGEARARLVWVAACLAGLLTSGAARGADPIPTSRRIDWSYAGVPGGIPPRTKICATFSPGATASAINSAISACTDGVVQLDPGTYNLTGLQIYKDDVTLRGAGADKTVLKGCGVVRLGSGGNIASGATLTGGGAKGTSTFTVASASGLSANMMIELDRDDDPALVVSTIGGTRHLRQVNVITAINGTTITVRNPLIWDFGSGSAKIRYTFINTRRSGVEDLKLDHSGTSGCINFNIEYCDSCWVKGVESYMAASYHFMIVGTVNGEFRDSYVHEAQTFGANNGGLAVYGNPQYGSNSSWKIENNVFDKLFPALELQNSSSGFYLGYNFSYGSAAQATDAPVTWTFADNHGPHDMMNLWEGNVGEMFGSDGYFGGSSHGTAFRNHLTGFNRNSSNHDEPVRLNRLSYHYNIVGNVLGSSSWAASKYNQTTDGCAGGAGIYRLGYPNIGNCSLTDVTGNTVPGGMTYPDAKVASTLLRWGNYDYYNKSTRWVSAEIPAGTPTPADQTLPSSYYYTSRPAWFNASVPWPPIGPDVSGGAAFGDSSGHVSKIPAQLCWESRNLGGGGSFNAAACYPGGGALPADAGPVVDGGPATDGPASGGDSAFADLIRTDAGLPSGDSSAVGADGGAGGDSGDSGCSCLIGPPGPSEHGALLLLGALVALRVRRRRRSTRR